MSLVGAKVPAQDSSSVYNRLFLEAVVERQKGNDTAAFDLLQRCVQINPNAAESHYYLAHYYLKLKKNKEALACFEKAARLEPSNTTYTETLAEMYVSLADYKNAIALWEKIFETDGSREDVLEMLFRLYQMDDNLDMAINSLTRLEVLEDKNEGISFAKSEILTRLGKKEEAIDEIRKLAEHYPSDLNYKGLYADILMQNDYDNEALMVYNEILDEEPDNNRAQMSIRSYFLKTGDTAKADSMTMKILLNKNTTGEGREYLLRQLISEEGNDGVDSIKVLSCFETIQRSDCRSADIGLLQAAYMRMKNMPSDSVERVLRQVMTFAPDNAPASLQLIYLEYERGNFEQVLKLAATSSQYNPEEMAFYYFEGMSLYQQDDKDGALNAFRKGVSVINDRSNPDIVSDFYSVLGDLYFQKGMRSEAYAAYDSCLQWKPDNYGCLNNYAYYLSEMGEQLEKAEQMSFKTVKNDPKNATCLDTYAWVLFKLERYAEAKVYIEQALQNEEDTVSHVLYEHAGDICAMGGFMEKAIEYWKIALQRDPQNKAIQRKLKHKKYIRQ